MGEAPDCTVVVSSIEEVDQLAPPDPQRVAYITQTTLSLDETRHIVERLRERFPAVQGPAAQDICYATENRQLAVKAVAPLCQLLLVVGSRNSSNSRRLVEVARNAGVTAYLLDDASELKPEWLEGVDTVAVTAGASAPEYLVQELLHALARQGFEHVEEVALKDEDVRFTLPPQLVQVTTRLSQWNDEARNLARTYARSGCCPGTRTRRPIPAFVAARTRGYWHAELYGGDTTLEVRLHPAGALAASAGQRSLESAHAPVDRKAFASILARQLPDGGFNIYPEGPAEVSASVKAYFA
jgi:hypothetical protein